MSELFSKAEDCSLLASRLKKKLGDKIDFYGSTYIEIPNGKYLSSYRKNNGEYMFNGQWLPFYFKFSENFVKHKNGKEVTIPTGAKVDGYPVTSYEKKLERKLRKI